MKIVARDQLDRDHVSEWLLADNVDEGWAEMIAEFANEKATQHGMFYFVTEPDEYEIRKFEP